MAQFTADIAGMLEIFAIAAGLVLLHRASKEAPANLLKAAGWVLVVGGVVVGACTGSSTSRTGSSTACTWGTPA